MEDWNSAAARGPARGIGAGDRRGGSERGPARGIGTGTGAEQPNRDPHKDRRGEPDQRAGRNRGPTWGTGAVERRGGSARRPARRTGTRDRNKGPEQGTGIVDPGWRPDGGVAGRNRGNAGRMVPAAAPEQGGRPGHWRGGPDGKDGRGGPAPSIGAAVHRSPRSFHNSGNSSTSSILRRYATPEVPPVPRLTPITRSTVVTWLNRQRRK